MQQEILDFWFSDEVRKLWFKSTPEFDALLRERFEALWTRASSGELDDWLQSAAGCLALVLVLDQFPLNMFRGQAQSFVSEAQSREVARLAIDKGFDQDLEREGRARFFTCRSCIAKCLPISNWHCNYSRNLVSKTTCVLLRHHHRHNVEKFGRFPHRNEALGRESSESEIEYLNSKEAFRG